MTNIFTVKLLKNGQLIQQRQVHTALAESTGAVRIKAQADTVYVLTEENSKKAVTKIRTLRVGNDLQVALEESLNGKPHLIIEDYFAAAFSNGALATTNSEGELVMYGADNPMSANLSNQVVTQTAIGAQKAWWHSAGAQLALIGGGLALLASSKSKSSSESNQSDKDIVTAYATAADTTRVTTPSLANYAGAGIQGVDSSNIEAVNSAINRARVKDLAGVQTVLNAYQKLFAKANGTGADNTTNDPALADYQTLNIKLSSEMIANQNHQIDLLNDIIKACGLKREDIYICNVLRCRPPGNRLPAPDEAANCREYLDGQIAHVNPEYIVCWGACAAQNLLGSTESIGKMRGRFFNYGSAKVACTYHPSYLMRNPAAKKDVWEDMKWLFLDMGIDLRAKRTS
jgi:uracil-DNA glycosylase family 4